jgi:hypothetical protein
VNICSVDGCNREIYAKGFCRKHINQIYQYGKILKRTKFDPNEILTKDDIGILILRNEKGSVVGKAIFDLADIAIVKAHKWYLNSHGYAITRVNRKEQLFLHRLIMNPPEGMFVDHINGNPLDNQRCNLRLCTHQENMFNKKIRKDNAYGCTGVDYDKRRKKWRARIHVNGKDIHLGYFDIFEHAANSRIAAERKHFGEFSRIDSQVINLIKNDRNKALRVEVAE